MFVPANSTFEAIPEEDLNALLEYQDQLSEVLTHHVVEGQQTPSDLEEGVATAASTTTSTPPGRASIPADQGFPQC